ncbi:MAG: NUDIX hydrolase [Cyclobacteriaceae bacterium]|nr:NUDIX hydrolase [Cyclobacteriaceae bacterium]
MNYCPNCGSQNLEFKIPDGDLHQRYVCANCHTVHYINPRIIVGCLPVYEDKIIICRRAIEPCHGMWNLPAGFMENGERAEDGALRELKEETGLDGQILKLHCIYSIPHVNQVYMIFLTRINSPDAVPGEESLEVRYFEEHEVPWGEIGFTSSVYAIEKFIEYKSSTGNKTYIGSFVLEGPETRKEFS